MTYFRDRIDAAIASHRRLDTPEFRQAASQADPTDRSYWHSQVQLDTAITAWRRHSPVRPPRREKARRTGAFVAVAAAGILVGWLGRPIELEPSATETPLDVRLAADTRPADVPLPIDAIDAALVARVESDEFAQAAATANRLAYALEPVGERVQVVVRFLVDAVPGSDVFAM